MNLSELFPLLQDYVIVKMSDSLPQYKINEDLDIFTSNIHKNIDIIINWYDKSVFRHSLSHVNSNHIHLDLSKHGESFLHFRFDLFSTFEFTKFSLDPSVSDLVLKNRIKNDRGAYVPCLNDDLSLRYCEYIEYIGKRDDKVKHLHYVEKYGDVSFHKIVCGETNSMLNYS